MSKARKNILVTGASEPIGERLVRKLLSDSRVNRVIATSGMPIDALPLPVHKRLTLFQVDLHKARHVHSLLFGPARDLKIDTIIHTAMVRSASEAGRRVRALNVDATRSLISVSERHPTINRIIIRSAAEVYQVQRDLPALIGEDHPLNLQPGAPQWVRDRVEADLTTCARMGLSNLKIVVLRMAEALAPGTGSQLFDYLESPVCFQPAGFDPMLNVLTIADTVAAIERALHKNCQGVFNIPGADTLPLASAIRRWGRLGIPVPEIVLSPLYRVRRKVTGHDFSYGMNRRRFHYSGVLDGTRARMELGYVPAHPVNWPVDN